MATISLSENVLRGTGQRFTAAGLTADDLTLTPLTVGVLGAERVEGEQVIRSTQNSDRTQSRTVAYKIDPAQAQSRSALEWWDQRLDLAADGAISAVRRDVLTGTLVVDDSFLRPTGLVTGFSRFTSLNADRTSLLPGFQIQGGSWDVAQLIGVQGAALHALLTSGDDVVLGSDQSDQISAGAGVNSLYGRGGVDGFFFGRGSAAKWYRKKQKNKGLQITPRKGSLSGRYAYDSSVDVVYDYEKGIDELYLSGSPGRYDFADVNGNTLVFADRSQRNLVAVVLESPGLGAKDFLGF